ncbi:disease resistance protein-like [Dorcoceras hygrometricum]|uniref:Disease resistance protein-like n=1 Tax=Dorcoceras hygrometricum TaxID=472368 RepID=A0A2Z6ZUR0_9LAMI|nr:disease resistance protein-like [Dorcoceras hygrometricum]
MGGVVRCWLRRRCALDDAWSADERRCWSSDVRWLREIAHGVASHLARRRARCRREFCGGGGAGWPPLRRVSGDVVTAGLISSRFWFGPVPGSP